MALAAPTASPAEAATPGAVVRIDGPAHEGPRGQILLDLRLSCRPGLTVSRLALVFSQGDVVGPQELANPPACDGRVHRLRHGSVEGFDPGQAHVDIAVTLVDTVSGAARGTVDRSKDVFVRPAARVWLPRTATLTSDGAVRAVVRGRCDEPWTPGDFYVSGSQDGSFGDALLDITCDGRVHARVVTLRSVAAVFTAGRIEMSAELTVFDEFFDPVAQGRASRSVRLVS
jgi:hypothetical protein